MSVTIVKSEKHKSPKSEKPKKKEDGRGRPKTSPATLATLRIDKKLDILLKFHNLVNPYPSTED